MEDLKQHKQDLEQHKEENQSLRNVIKQLWHTNDLRVNELIQREKAGEDLSYHSSFDLFS